MSQSLDDDVLQHTGKPSKTIRFNLGNPYVIASLPKPAFSLCTFRDVPDSIDAAVQVLFGELKPQGQLPVRISDSYPFGHRVTRS